MTAIRALLREIEEAYEGTQSVNSIVMGLKAERGDCAILGIHGDASQSRGTGKLGMGLAPKFRVQMQTSY